MSYLCHLSSFISLVPPWPMFFSKFFNWCLGFRSLGMSICFLWLNWLPTTSLLDNFGVVLIQQEPFEGVLVILFIHWLDSCYAVSMFSFVVIIIRSRIQIYKKYSKSIEISCKTWEAFPKLDYIYRWYKNCSFKGIRFDVSLIWTSDFKQAAEYFSKKEYNTNVYSWLITLTTNPEVMGSNPTQDK